MYPLGGCGSHGRNTVADNAGLGGQLEINSSGSRSTKSQGSATRALCVRAGGILICWNGMRSESDSYRGIESSTLCDAWAGCSWRQSMFSVTERSLLTAIAWTTGNLNSALRRRSSNSKIRNSEFIMRRQGHRISSKSIAGLFQAAIKFLMILYENRTIQDSKEFENSEFVVRRRGHQVSSKSIADLFQAQLNFNDIVWESNSL